MIHLEDLRVRAGDFTLQIDELALDAGEYLVILGPTGSGKTLLLDTVAGMRRPAQGRVWFGDRDVTQEPPERRRTGVVYQDYALFPHLTVAGNIGFGLRGAGPDGAGPSAARGAKRIARSAERASREARTPGRRAARSAARAAQVERLASLLGIQGLLDRYPDSLSGGERQRVALARALAIEPEVLLLDEPLSALDRTTRRELRDELKRLHRTLRATVLHVTHDLDEALTLGDRVAVLLDGRLRQVSPPGEAVRHPADGAVARLVGMQNVFPIASMTAAAVAPGATAEGAVRIRLGSEGRGGSPEGLELTAVAPSLDRSGGPAVAVISAEEIAVTRVHDTDGDFPGREQESGSGWNVLAGTITEVQLQSVHACLTVDVPPALSVHVLRPDVERMGLSVGSRVTLRIPPESIHICPE
ncbi:MAG: ABC transporter ATP-binding protein [Thermoleophilia bacterium]|nr:ABC transporter ATP-binding protein [Thermoleophilia bacterium]